MDYSQYPKKERQYEFFESYLKTVTPEREPSEEELHRLYVNVNKCSLLSNMFWATWSLVQAHVSDIKFDYMDYAIRRYKQYYILKKEFENLQ